MKRKGWKMKGAYYSAYLVIFLLVVFSLLVLIENAMAVLDCDVTQNGAGLVVFRMLRLNNTHAELYNGTENYPYDVNCSCSVSLNRTCDQAIVLKLHNTTNAHAEYGTLSNFDNYVCLTADTNGTVYCTYNTSLPSGYDVCVCSMSNETQAHVGDCVTEPFDTKVYCGIVYTPNITSVTCKYNSTDGYHCVVAFDMGDNPAGTEHYTNETTGNSGGDDQDWTSSTANYIDTGLAAHTQYCYKAKARRIVGNETVYSSLVCDTMENVPPNKIVLSYPENGDGQFTNRTPKFNWTEGTDQDGDTLTYHIQVSLNSDCSDPLINETGIPNNYYQQDSELEFATYYWRVRANDSYEYGEWSDIWNFTLVTYIEINLTNDLIEFGMMALNEVNDTADGDPEPFKMENIGNTEANISVNATSLWDSESLDTEYYQFKANRTDSQDSFNWSLSQTTWENISSSYKLAIAYFNHTDGNDDAALDLKIKVPESESPGTKNSTIEFYSEVA